MNTQYENVSTVFGKDTKITTLQDTQVYNNIYPCDDTATKIPNSYPGHDAFDIRTYNDKPYINNFGCDLEVLSCEKSSTSANGVVLKVYAKQYDKTFVYVHCALDTSFAIGAIIKKGATICSHLENHLHIYVLMGETTDTNKRIAGAMGQYLVWESPWFGLNSLLKDSGGSTSTPPPTSGAKTFKAVRSGKSSDNGTFYFDEKYYNDFKDKKQSADAVDTTGEKWLKDTTWTEVYAPTGGSSTPPPTTFKATYLGSSSPEDKNKQFTFANEYKSAFGSVGVKQATSKDVKTTSGTTWYKGSTFRRDN